MVEFNLFGRHVVAGMATMRKYVTVPRKTLWDEYEYATYLPHSTEEKTYRRPKVVVANLRMTEHQKTTTPKGWDI